MEIKKPDLWQPIPEHAKRVFKGAIFDAYQWEQEGYDGKMRTFEKIKRPDTALIIPVTEDGKIIIADQEQPGKQFFTGLIGGRVNEGENPLEAAKRELLEETGYASEDWSLFDSIQPHNKIEWAVYTFFAKGCRKVAEQNLDGAEKVDLVFVDFDTFIETILSKKFSDTELKLKIMEAKLNPSKMAEFKKQLGV